MARFDFAHWMPISGSSGSYTGGPFRIVHHTTEGSNAQGAFDAFRTNRSDPHFTVNETTIFQHIDTAVAARSLKHPHAPQTNRLSAVQIEVVGFFSQAKSLPTLLNVARLCRAIEEEHGIPKVWPSGFPVRRADPNPDDPIRSVDNWTSQGGHYGHCHVPENDHFDPGYSVPEVHIVMQDVRVIVNDNTLQEAGGFLDDSDHVQAWVRPIAAAINAQVMALTSNSITLQRKGSSLTLPAEVSDGFAFIPLGQLDGLSGVNIDFDDTARALTITTDG